MVSWEFIASNDPAKPQVAGYRNNSFKCRIGQPSVELLPGKWLSEWSEIMKHNDTKCAHMDDLRILSLSHGRQLINVKTSYQYLPKG
ncbi:hypothetical protein CDAR_68711 [Caerostris darwini]|uniref:Uncharacterized protein n=1 Tax=Caerostris darwini TaxID=1538125 RepID=A0AAV4WZ14_9ARAC|nr:hypothetical protein CDAR_68711 [Caerostris darwini]